MSRSRPPFKPRRGRQPAPHPIGKKRNGSGRITVVRRPRHACRRQIKITHERALGHRRPHCRQRYGYRGDAHGPASGARGQLLRGRRSCVRGVRRARGISWATAFGTFPRASESPSDPAGSAARRCRAASRVRPVAGRLPPRGSTLEHRQRGQPRRHDIPAPPSLWRSRSAAARWTCSSATPAGQSASQPTSRAAPRPTTPASRRSGLNVGSGTSREKLSKWGRGP